MRAKDKRLAALEGSGSRMVVAKLEADGDVGELLAANGIALGSTDLLVRITRPDGVGSDFVRIKG